MIAGFGGDLPTPLPDIFLLVLGELPSDGGVSKLVLPRVDAPRQWVAGAEECGPLSRLLLSG